MSRYRLRPKAIEDLEAIGDFIAADNPVRAVSFIDDLLAVCSRIAERPQAHALNQAEQETSPAQPFETRQ